MGAAGNQLRAVRNKYNNSLMTFMHSRSELVTGVTKGDLVFIRAR